MLVSVSNLVAIRYARHMVLFISTVHFILVLFLPLPVVGAGLSALASSTTSTGELLGDVNDDVDEDDSGNENGLGDDGGDENNETDDVGDLVRSAAINCGGELPSRSCLPRISLPMPVL